MRKFATIESKVTTAYLGIRPQLANRQTTRALHTDCAEWRRIRAAVLKRDLYRCSGYPKGKHADGCNGFANEVDHIDGDSTNDVKDGSNYQSLSKPCHSRKTIAEITQR